MAKEPETQTPPEELVWEPLSTAKRKRLQKCFEHGESLAKGDKPNHDYANDMLTQCVTHDPGNLVYVDAFLANLRAKYNNNKKGGRLGSRNPLKKAVANKEWTEAFKLGAELLAGNPWDVQTLRWLAEACEAYGFNEVELRYLKNALDANPKDIEVNKHCADSLARVGQFDQAIACWNRIAELRGGKDDEADAKISELTLEKTRIGTGLGSDETATGRAVNALPGQGAASDQAQTTKPAEPVERRTIELTQRQLLDRAISDNPDDIDSYVQLAKLNVAEGRHADAVKTLQKALDASGGGDLRVRRLLEDAEITHMKAQLGVAEKRAAAEKSEETQSLAAQLREQLARHELEIFAKRAEQNPDDKVAQVELANRLRRVGNLDEAINMLLAAREDTAIKPRATLELGECYQQKKRYKEALKCYTRAVELTAVEGSDVRVRKLALYRAGILTMASKEYSQAKALFTKLVAIDPKYRDAKARLDKIAQKSDKG